MKTIKEKTGVQVRVQRSIVVLCSISMLNAGSAMAGGLAQVKPFEYSTGSSESLTSLYAQQTPPRGNQRDMPAWLVKHSLMPSLTSRLLPGGDAAVAQRSFSQVDPGGYYRASSLNDKEPSKLENAVYTVLGLGLAGGAMYLRAREIQLGFEEFKHYPY